MNNLEYLNQISAENRPQKTSSSLFQSKKLRFTLIGLTFISLLLLASSFFSDIGKESKELAIRSQLRSSNLIATINLYNRQVKSSALRAIGLSLSSTLNETTLKLDEELKSKLNYKKPPEKLQSEEQTSHNTLNLTLKNAELNGYLDRVYVRELTLQVALLIALNSEVIHKPAHKNFKSILEKSNQNLNQLHQELSNFSDKGI